MFNLSSKVLDCVVSLKWRLIVYERTSSFLPGARTGSTTSNLNCISSSFISTTSLTPLIWVVHFFCHWEWVACCQYLVYSVSIIYDSTSAQPLLPNMLCSCLLLMLQLLWTFISLTHWLKSLSVCLSLWQFFIHVSSFHISGENIGSSSSCGTSCICSTAQQGTVASCMTWGQREGGGSDEEPKAEKWWI